MARALSSAVLAFASALGCAAQSDSTSPQPAAATAGDATQTEIERELAKLSPEDRLLAAAQEICPVSDSPLGSMGKPLKVTVDGKSLFICCEGCRDQAVKDFNEHLAKLTQESNSAPSPQ